MKYLFILLFAAFGLTVSAQNTSPDVNQLMEQELKMIEKDLVKEGQNTSLTSEQTAKLKDLLKVKAEKVYAVREGGFGKMEMSTALKKINAEFDPAILEVFTAEQKAVFKASPRNKRKYLRKN